MKRRKGKLTKSKSKKQTVSVPKSDDSGVSSGLEMQKIEKKEETLSNNKIKISINLENIRRFIKQDNLNHSNESAGVILGLEKSTVSMLDGSQSDKSRFSFEDEAQSCLDYEPYEEEPEDYIDSPESAFQPQDTRHLGDSYDRNNTEDANCNIETIEKFYLGYNNELSVVKNSEVNSSNNNCIEIMKNSLMTSSSIRNCDNDSSDMVAHPVDFEQQPERTAEESCDNSANYWNDDKDDITNISKDDEYMQEEEGEEDFEESNPRCENEENRANVFKNVEVNFSGPLNITITRPVINKIESLMSNPKPYITNGETSTVDNRKYLKSPSNRMTTVTTSYPSGSNNLGTISHSLHNKSFTQKINWPKHKLYLNVVKITSGDDIFGYNIKRNLLMSTISCSRSEVSCMPDTDCIGEATKKKLEINYNNLSEVPCDEIRDDYKNRTSTNLFHSQNSKIRSSLMKNSRKSITRFENSLNVSDGKPLNIFSDNDLMPEQTKVRTIEDSPSGSGDGVFRHPLKRPPSRPQRISVDVHGPSECLEDDALSILGSSTILEAGSNISGVSESNTFMRENDKEEFVNRWLMCSTENNVNSILESLCESHFTSNCDNARCEKSHFIDEKRIKQLSPIKLTELYELAKEKIFWFTLLFQVFIDCFIASPENGRLCLVDMINDVFLVFEGSFIDKTLYISKIVCALQSTGLSFKEAIEYIILRYGTSQISICDILLFIISKESNLYDHWFLVQKVVCCRREKIDHEVVINFLHSSLSIYPPNIDLCKKIYYEIFEKNLVDLDRIPDFLWAPIRMALKSSKMLESRSLYPKVSDTKIQSNYLLDQNSTIPSASFDENRAQIENSRDVFGNVQFQSSDSSSSTYSEGLSEFNKSLWRMKHNQGRTYREDRNWDRTYTHPDDSQVCKPFCNRPVKINEISLTHNEDDSVLNNESVIIRNSRPLFPNDNFRNVNTIQNVEQRILHIADNDCYNQTGTSDQDVFKTPYDNILKKRNSAPNLGTIRHQINKESQQGAKTQTKSVYKNVLNKINKSLNVCRRSATPENSIAHPASQPIINSRYECNVSLHNLYPDVPVNATEITRNELIQLREALREENGSNFLNILEAYQNAFTIENFILNTLILIKTPTNTIDVFKKFTSLLSVIEDVDPVCLKKPHVKMVVEVLAMNLIYLLETKGEWGLCRNILLRIKMKNWHSLVTSKIFFCSSHLMSHMCRYIYISEILVRAGDFHWVNEIFQLNNLCLLGPMTEWPYQNMPSDLILRNEVLQLFLDEGFAVNIVAVNDLLNHINIVNGGNIEGFDVWKLFDDKLSSLLGCEEEHMSTLLYLSPHIVNYGRHMAENVLQCYMLFIKDYIADGETFKLFTICCEKGLYHKYTGNERVIIITTKMCDFEISSILGCFFENILKRCIRPHDFCIELKLPEPDQATNPQLYKNRLNRSIFTVYAIIMNILKSKYKIIVQQAIESTILVTENMQHFLPFID